MEGGSCWEIVKKERAREAGRERERDQKERIAIAVAVDAAAAQASARGKGGTEHGSTVHGKIKQRFSSACWCAAAAVAAASARELTQFKP